MVVNYLSVMITFRDVLGCKMSILTKGIFHVFNGIFTPFQSQTCVQTDTYMSTHTYLSY